MSSTLDVEEKQPNNSSNHINTTISTNNKPKSTKKKKKKNILYQETAIKYYNGFMKNKRYKKGIKLSTGCAIFKIAWELPENNGLLLPSRVQRHLKQVLPKKPKQNKNKNKKKLNNDKTHDKDESPRPSVSNITVTSATDDHDIPDNDPLILRSRTMQNMHNISGLSSDLDNTQTEREHQYHRTMLPSTANTLSIINAQNVFCDTIEAMIDEQKHDEDTAKNTAKHMLSKSVDLRDFDDINPEDLRPLNTLKPTHNDTNNAHAPSTNTTELTEVKTTDTSTYHDHADAPSNTDIYHDHAHILMDDLQPDIEQQPPMPRRAQTDINNLHHDDIISIKLDLLEEQEEQKESTETSKTKKKKKKRQVLYAEDATRLFRKITEGKRFKNGIRLKKTCHIFSLAWELPEENGKILPSKVARHFKHVLPSKKAVKGTIKITKKRDSNIKPSVALKTKDTIHKPQTMRGHTKPNWVTVDENKKKRYQHELRRTVVQVPSVKDLNIPVVNDGKKKSMISQLETLMALDPHRIDDDDREGKVVNKKKRAVSMTDLDLEWNMDQRESMSMSMSMSTHQHDMVIENDIEMLIEENKKLKQKEKEKEKEEGVMNAIDASLGL